MSGHLPAGGIPRRIEELTRRKESSDDVRTKDREVYYPQGRGDLDRHLYLLGSPSKPIGTRRLRA